MVAFISNIEFYNTPEGDVMMKEFGQPAVVFKGAEGAPPPDYRTHACCHQGQISESTCPADAALFSQHDESLAL